MSNDRRLSCLQQELQALSPGLSYDQVFEAIVRISRDLMKADSMAILCPDKGGLMYEVGGSEDFDLARWERERNDQPSPGEVSWLQVSDLGAAATLVRAGFASGSGSGVVCVGYARRYEPEADDLDFLRMAAHQIGLAAGRRTQQDTLQRETAAARRQVRLWRALAQLGQAVMRTEDRIGLMRQVCNIAVEYGDFAFAWVGERDASDEIRPVAWSGAEGETLRELGVRLDPSNPRGTGPAARALREGRLVTAADLWADPKLLAWHELAARFALHSVAAVPIVAGGVTAAVLVIYAEGIGEFEDGSVQAVLAEIAQELGFGLDVIDERRRRIEAEEQLRLHHEIVEQAKECLVVAKVLPDGKVRFVYANPAFENMTGYRIDEMIGKASEMLWGPRTDRKAIAAMHDVVLAGKAWSGEVWQYRKDGSAFLMEWSAVPLRDEEGRIAYILSSHRDVTERRRASERVAHMAHHDALTGLPNRRLLEERLAHALHRARRHRHRFALAFIDLDEFKQVNDSLGHGFGDKLLQQLAHRLQDMVRGEDTIARSGGDEFILLVDTVRERAEIDHLLDRIVHALEEPCLIGGRTFAVRGSIGLAVFPEDGEDMKTLMRRADIAMYAAKKSDGARYRYFAPEMEDAVALRGNLRARLQAALARGELELHYQPQVDLVHQEVVGFEALLRWRDPVEGLRLPGEFLPAVEGTPLEQEIGRFVLHAALNQAEAFSRQGLALQVAFNASPSQFLSPAFTRELEEALALHPTVSPQQLAIEITESAVVHDVELARRQIEVCHRLGVAVALDDFGTGSSSITLLQELPCDIIKIDQRFIAGMLETPESPAIIHGILIMGSAMDRRVLAEGVETATQARALLRLGCHLVQGYAVARPMPAAAIGSSCTDFTQRAPLVVGGEIQDAAETFQLLAVELGHLRWAALFTATATGTEAGTGADGRYKKVRGTCCGLGYWLETYGRSQFALHPALADVEREHLVSHDLAAATLRLRAEGDLKAAAVAAERLWRQKDDLIMALARLKP